MGSETELSKKIRDALDRIGVWNIRIPSGMINVGKRWIRMAPKGTPDILLPSFDGQGSCGWLEVKTDEGKLSEEQKQFQLKSAAENVRVAVVRSVKEAIETVMSWRQK